MLVTDHAVYIEEAKTLENADDFVEIIDEHGARIYLSKDVVREAHAFLTNIGEA